MPKHKKEATQVYFNLETGEVVCNGYVVDDVEKIGDGWVRCWMATKSVEMTLFRRIWYYIKYRIKRKMG